MGDLIERKGIASGRVMKEDDNVINVAELIEALKTATEAVQTKLNAGIDTTLSGSYPFGAVPFTLYNASEEDSCLLITKPAEANKSHYITAFEVIGLGGEIELDIVVSIKVGENVIWQTGIGIGASSGTRVGMVLSNPIKLATNSALTLEVSSGGLVVYTIANLAGYTV